MRKKMQAQTSALPRQGGVDVRFQDGRFVDLVAKIWRHQGYSGFFNGLMAQNARVIPQVLSLFVMFKLLGSRFV